MLPTRDSKPITLFSDSTPRSCSWTCVVCICTCQVPVEEASQGDAAQSIPSHIQATNRNTNRNERVDVKRTKPSVSRFFPTVQKRPKKLPVKPTFCLTRCPTCVCMRTHTLPTDDPNTGFLCQTPATYALGTLATPACAVPTTTATAVSGGYTGLCGCGWCLEAMVCRVWDWAGISGRAHPRAAVCSAAATSAMLTGRAAVLCTVAPYFCCFGRLPKFSSI